jgi:acetyl esterase/lipase
LAYEHEGLELAQWLVENGVAAFVVKYRVPGSVNVGVQDAQRAMSIVRSRAAEWNIDPQAIGAAGFSAGGQILGQMAVFFQEADRGYAAIDAFDQVSFRPNFAAMVSCRRGGGGGGRGARTGGPVHKSPWQRHAAVFLRTRL